VIDLVSYIERHRAWSIRTFGPGERVVGILAHIKKEMEEIEAIPDDLDEWIDIIILAIDGAWRAGHEPNQIAAALAFKQSCNFQRKWPPLNQQSSDKPTEHIRET
jgi:hypothetical protein